MWFGCRSRTGFFSAAETAAPLSGSVDAPQKNRPDRELTPDGAAVMVEATGIEPVS